MAARSILDADMTTVFGWLRSGFAWWVAELQAMVPQALRPKRVRISEFVAAHANGQFYYHSDGDVRAVGDAPIKSGDVTVMINEALVLKRTLSLPAMSEPDLRKLIALDADRLFPMPASSLLLAVSKSRSDALGKGQARVNIACLPVAQAQMIVTGLAAQGLTPNKLFLRGAEESGDPDMDFTPAFAEADLVARRTSAAFAWWMLVAFLFALNIGMLVMRDVQSTQQLEQLVESQAPAVNAARAIARRISNNQLMAQQLVDRRTRQDGVGALANLTETLPAQAWIQRYSWDGRIIRLTGYKKEGVDVLGALRKSPLLVNVRSTNSDAIAELPTGQPFDLTAEVRQGGVR